MEGRIYFSISGTPGETVNYSVELTVFSHIPPSRPGGGNQWNETGGSTTVSGSFTIPASGSGTTSESYSIAVNPVPGANSYRVQVTDASSNVVVASRNTKGPSLQCFGPPTKPNTRATSLLSQLWLVAAGREL